MLQIINSILWAVASSLIIITGIYFSKKLSFPQLNFKKIISSLKYSNNSGITPIKALFLALAGRIGVGSIAGVALAIYLGGPGTIFWMWVIAIISGSLTYAETLLGTAYKEKKNGEFFGGPSYYIKKGLNNKKLAIVYSLIVIIAYIFGFIPIQSNTIVKSSNMLFNNDHILIGIVLSVITFLIIIGGIKRITRVTDKLVPFMTIIYILLSICVIIVNSNKFIGIINLIIENAFTIKPFFTGFIYMLLIGIQRGIFSNESGIGLGSIAASSSSCSNGKQNGYIQVLGTYITTILICTSTAFMILMFDYNGIVINNLNGIEITSLAFKYHFGMFGNILLSLCILLFSFTTILTGYYYCQSCLTFLTKKRNINMLKIVIPGSVFMGTIFSSNIIWKIIDILVAILSIINLYSLYQLRKEIVKYSKKYDRI